MTGTRDELALTLSRRLRTLPFSGTAADRAERFRRLLEECGVRCDESLAMTGLVAVIIASHRGTEALVAAGLSDERRCDTYARIVARLLLDQPAGFIDARFEYAGPLPSHARPDERARQILVEGLASALADGEIEKAPRALYLIDDDGEPPHARAALQRLLDRWSLALYQRSSLYRRLRARRDVAAALGRVSLALSGSAPAAA